MDVVAESALGEIGGSVVGAVQHPLGGQQTLDADRAAGVNARRRDAHLGAQTEAEAVRKARRCIVEHTGAVHLALEVLGRLVWIGKLMKTGEIDYRFW